jgi:hypothetical protein
MMNSKRVSWVRHVEQMEMKKNYIGYLWESSRRETPLIRPRRRWEDNIKIDLRGIGWDVMDWIDLAQDRDQ